MYDKRLPVDPMHLDKRVTIQQSTEVIDSAGVPSETWTDLTCVPMGRRSASGFERWQANQETSQFDTAWMMQYRSDMDPDLVNVPKSRRLVYQGRTMDIVTAEHVGRKDGIALMTRASTEVA